MMHTHHMIDYIMEFNKISKIIVVAKFKVKIFILMLLIWDYNIIKFLVMNTKIVKLFLKIWLRHINSQQTSWQLIYNISMSRKNQYSEVASWHVSVDQTAAFEVLLCQLLYLLSLFFLCLWNLSSLPWRLGLVRSHYLREHMFSLLLRYCFPPASLEVEPINLQGSRHRKRGRCVGPRLIRHLFYHGP